MKSASPFVYVENVKDSVEYYQNIFGGEIKILNKHEGKVMHAELAAVLFIFLIHLAGCLKVRT